MPEYGLGLALVWPLIESLDALRYCDRDDVFGLLREAIEERWPEIEMSQRRQPEPLEDQEHSSPACAELPPHVGCGDRVDMTHDLIELALLNALAARTFRSPEEYKRCAQILSDRLSRS
jgi:hypothetical protein